MKALIMAGAMLMTTASAYCDPCANPTREVVLDAIRWVESKNDLHGLRLYPHQYCSKSWGQYGLTQAAVNELIRRNKLAAGTRVQEVAGATVSEARQREVAGQYLDVCLEAARREKVYGAGATWLHAALVYHGWTGEASVAERVVYGRRLRNAIERRCSR
jgi:hypothetical protein